MPLHAGRGRFGGGGALGGEAAASSGAAGRRCAGWSTQSRGSARWIASHWRRGTSSSPGFKPEYCGYCWRRRCPGGTRALQGIGDRMVLATLLDPASRRGAQ
jgi:hypothetical protein